MAKKKTSAPSLKNLRKSVTAHGKELTKLEAKTTHVAKAAARVSAVLHNRAALRKAAGIIGARANPTLDSSTGFEWNPRKKKAAKRGKTKASAKQLDSALKQMLSGLLTSDQKAGLSAMRNVQDLEKRLVKMTKEARYLTLPKAERAGAEIQDRIADLQKKMVKLQRRATDPAGASKVGRYLRQASRRFEGIMEMLEAKARGDKSRPFPYMSMMDEDAV